MRLSSCEIPGPTCERKTQAFCLLYSSTNNHIYRVASALPLLRMFRVSAFAYLAAICMGQQLVWPLHTAAANGILSSSSGSSISMHRLSCELPQSENIKIVSFVCHHELAAVSGSGSTRYDALLELKHAETHISCRAPTHNHIVEGIPGTESADLATKNH